MDFMHEEFCVIILVYAIRGYFKFPAGAGNLVLNNEILVLTFVGGFQAPCIFGPYLQGNLKQWKRHRVHTTLRAVFSNGIVCGAPYIQGVSKKADAIEFTYYQNLNVLALFKKYLCKVLFCSWEFKTASNISIKENN